MPGSGPLSHIRAARAVLREQKVERQKDKPRGPARNSLELEFLPAYLEILERPPARQGRLFGISIIALFGGALIWSVFGELDVIASAPGKVIVSQHSKVVQAADPGEVTKIAVRDGQLVRQGDVLVELNPTAARADLHRLREQSKISALRVARLEALLTEDPLDRFTPPSAAPDEQTAHARALLSGEVAHQQATRETYALQLLQNETRQGAAGRMIEESGKLLATVSERSERLKTLVERGHYPRLQFLELQQELIAQSRELEEQESSLSVLKAEARTLVSEAKRQEAEWRRGVLDRLEEERARLVDLGQELIKAEETARLQTILAPVDGMIQQLAIHTVGGIVTAGQELMVIVPDSADLEAEISILNNDVGFIVAGQPVEVKIDSFPYTKYGTVKGEVLHVSRDSTKDEELGLVYPARVKLAAVAIQVEQEIVPLSAGMRVVAEIKTGERRVIDYLLSPLQEYRSESLRER